MAVSFNSDKVGIPEAAGGERVIESQLRSTTYKEELVALQRINHSFTARWILSIYLRFFLWLDEDMGRPMFMLQCYLQ